jgi:hypothetical protein
VSTVKSPFFWVFYRISESSVHKDNSHPSSHQIYVQMKLVSTELGPKQ